MNLLTGFSTAVGVSLVNETLPYLRQLFIDANDYLQEAPGLSKNFRTTLAEYNSLEFSNVLDTSEEADKVRAAIELAAKNFAVACGYDADKYTPVVVNFWLNEMKPGSAHRYHSHPGMHFSGCIYIDMPPKAPGVMFRSHKDRFDYKNIAITQCNNFNSPGWLINPEEGHLCIWESWVQHGVDPAEYEGVRRSAAFDVVMKPIKEAI